ncbi:MAG TPA: hypothetical protein VF546_12000 [Pyrinomonadaceae bacterium]
MSRASLAHALRRRLAPRRAPSFWLALACALGCALLGAPAAVRAQTLCATAGNDGPNATLSGVVNTYYPGVGTASAGGNTITVGTPTGAATVISGGDLLLVIQMQDAQIDTRNSNRYGDGVSGDPGSGALATNFNAGLYEYVVAVNLVGASLTVRGTGTGSGLRNTYTTAAWSNTQGQRTFQVVRVPQYSSATVAGATTLSARAWDGSTGGVVAVDVAGTLTVNGTVSADGRGFRGGGGRGTSGGGSGAGTPATTDYMLPTSWNLNGQKGEGVAGTPRYVYNGTSVVDTGAEGYPGNTTFTAGAATGRGAPGNAGGGGTDGSTANNEENSGGGGGGNGGAGGMGGMTWRNRDNIGGFGGVMPTTVPPSNTRVVMGGGGGAGSRNNSSGVAASGAVGGGIVMIRAGTLAGGGTVSANGSDAYNLTLNDGGGGGGAGGSILVSAGTYAGAIALSARGGRGGDAWNTSPVGTICGSTPCDTDNRHGPGGGGGGGYVASTWSGAANVAGGANGITTTTGAPNNTYGATPGNAGTSATLTASSIPGANPGYQCLPVLTVTKTTSTPSVKNTPTGVTATYTITVANQSVRSTAQNVTLSDTLPSLFTYASTGPITTNNGAARSSVSDPTAGDAVPAWGVFQIPGGASVALTFTVNIAFNAAGTYQNPAAATYADPTRTVASGTAVATYNSASSTNEDVTVTGAPKLKLEKTCSAPADCLTAAQSPGAELTYTITFTNEGGAPAAGLTIVDIIPLTINNTAMTVTRTTDLKVGSLSFNPGDTGLLASALTPKYYRDAIPYPLPPTPWAPTIAYTPPGANGTFDTVATYVAWQITGNIPAGKTGSVSFTVKIK